MDFDFTKTEYERICEEAMLHDIDKKILECKVKGMTHIETASVCGMSPDNVKKRFAKIKRRIFKVM